MQDQNAAAMLACPGVNKYKQEEENQSIRCDPLCVIYCTTLSASHTMIREQLIGKAAEGSGGGLI